MHASAFHLPETMAAAAIALAHPTPASTRAPDSTAVLDAASISQPSRALAIESGVQQSFTNDRFALRCGIEVPVELVYHVYHNGVGDPFAKPIVLVHSALTGSSKLFLGDGLLTPEQKQFIRDQQKDKDSQGDAWAEAICDIHELDIRKYTVISVDTLAGNPTGKSTNHLSSGRDFYRHNPEALVYADDQVKLVTQMLATHGVTRIEKILGFSAGGANLPAWLAQDEIKVAAFYNMFTNYHLDETVRDFWQLQVDLLKNPGIEPDFAGIAQRLRKNFGLEERDCPSVFAGCVQGIAAQVLALKPIYDSELDHEKYLVKALEVVRKLSFLRFQTEAAYESKGLEGSLSYLDGKGRAFSERMDPINYRSLVERMLEASPLYLKLEPKEGCPEGQLVLHPEAVELQKLKRERGVKIVEIRASSDMLYPVQDFCPLADVNTVLFTNRGHDVFFVPGAGADMKILLPRI